MLDKELKKRNLPDLLFSKNGEYIQNVQKWETLQKPFWRELLLQEEYGKIPPMVLPEISSWVKPISFGGKAVWEVVTFTFRYCGKEHTISTQMIYPINSIENPFIIYLNFSSNIPDIYLPLEEIIDNGFGIFTVCHDDITKDNNDFTDGLARLFQESERKDDDTGKLMYWAYMASRMMDYLQTRKEADKERIGIAGHSRLGKTALLASALDDRFSFVYANESGCSGASLSSGHCEKSETIKSICTNFPFWFCPNYYKYAGKDNELPFDQHCLLALSAPRHVYVSGAIEDVWADNDNQFLSCVAASKVWNVYGKIGIVTPNRLPVCGDVFKDGEIGFHLRGGDHFHSRTDWLIFMDWLKLKNCGKV